MIKIDLTRQTYTCPYCEHVQSFCGRYNADDCGFAYKIPSYINEKYLDVSFRIYSFKCANPECERICVTAINASTEKQLDIVPQVAMKHYPDYIPEQIRRDYEEANLILDRSPKAAATLLRRCLQGMIHDFWGIKEKNLNAELTCLKDKVTPMQWKAIDGLRKIGNIGAHMEKDVNLMIDIEPEEAKKLLKLIEMLLEKWYITRHDEEVLLTEIVGIAESKEEQRK